MKVALVHDHLAQDGGAEKVLKVLAEMYPDAPIYTLLYEKDNADKYYKNRRIDASIIQKLPGGVKHYKWYMPFMPMAVEFFDLGEYDLVISSASALVKGVITKPETLHICYCHTPTRYLWSDTHEYINELKYNKYFKKVIALMLSFVRVWDRLAADRVDKYIANSQTIARRIQKYYKRNSVVIFPPVDVEKFKKTGLSAETVPAGQKYFLIGCRLAPYKRVDLAIRAFKKMSDKNLKIFGDGIDRKRLEIIVNNAPNIEFLGRVGDEELISLYQNAEAFIHPQEEDFGITPVESMAAGCPVIAFKKGGATETITEGITGTFFAKQTPDSLREAVCNFNRSLFNPEVARERAEKYSVENFKKNIKRYIDQEYENWHRH